MDFMTKQISNFLIFLNQKLFIIFNQYFKTSIQRRKPFLIPYIEIYYWNIF